MRERFFDYLLSGVLAVVTTYTVIYQPFPTGQRHPEPRIDPGERYQCTQCDPGAPTEQCFAELEVCAKLSDTALTVFGTDGVRRRSMALNPRCRPRCLQRLTYNGLHLSIECHGYSSQVVSIDSDSTELTLHDPNGRVVHNEILVEGAREGGGREVYRVEIEDYGALYRSSFHSSHPLDITPDIDCNHFISLYPLHTRDKFLLWCGNGDEKFLYVVWVNHNFPEYTPHFQSNSPPLSSPDGHTFVTVANSTLKVYRTDCLISQSPGARDFDSKIVFHTFIDNNTLLLVLEGQTQSLVNIDLFINSSGTDGVTPLSTASVTATLHKSIMGDAYVTYNKSGTLYNLLVFTTEGRLVSTFPNFDSIPADVFFQPGPPPVKPSSTAIVMDGTVTKTSKTATITSTQTSSLHPPTDTPDDPTSTPTTIHVGVIVGVVIATCIFIAFSLILLLVVYKRLALWQRNTHPIQETEKGNALPASHTNNSVLKPFNEPAPEYTSDSSSQLFPPPVLETGST